MNGNLPIFTEKARCQDCYRCVRNCPVKAIKIEQGVASVMNELCIHCGRCVQTCPVGAKKVRDDRPVLSELLERKEKVIISLAPSWAAEFSEVSAGQLIAALKEMGVYGVSETALGAQEVSSHAARLMNSGTPRTWISSACPTVVEYIQKYHPRLVDSITPFFSPLLAHSAMLKREYGDDTHVVFFGPCISKKNEAFAHPELLEAVLGFNDLKLILNEKKLDLTQQRAAEDAAFIPRAAEEGALYPVDGGMAASMKSDCSVTDGQTMHFSGIEEIASVLESVEMNGTDESLFLELLACPGGCINGPVTEKGAGTLSKRKAVLKKVEIASGSGPRPVTLDISARYNPDSVGETRFSELQIKEILHQTGKYSPEDELNCSGCGYVNCRSFAEAVLAGKAETAMCVTFMRQLANKKANKLIMAMPSGVVIVDKYLKILECNYRFALLAGEETADIYQVNEGLTGANLEKVLPVSHLFSHVLGSEQEIVGKDIRIGDRVVRCSVFSIEPQSIAGGIFSDVTAPELEKDEIIRRAESVIQKNLTTVQQIAYLLGENASDTEMVLSSIINSFKPGTPSGDADNGQS